MRIGISAAYRMHGGGLVHLRNLLKAWTRMGITRKHSIILFTRPENLPALQLVPGGGLEIRPTGSRFFNVLGKLVWEQVMFPRLLAQIRPDVVFCPGNIVPLRSPVPTVVAYRNAAPFCSSVTLRATGPSEWLAYKAQGALMRLSADAARRAIFISHYFKDLFVERFGFPPERCDVIYHGRDGLSEEQPDRSLLDRLGVVSPYILCVSHLQSYKNIPALIEGYAVAQQTLQRCGLRLALAGKPVSESYARRLNALIHKQGLDRWIILTGNLPHPAVATLLAHCHFLVFQSTCENCPTALIEAMAAGVPIACSNASVMPEIAGDSVLYFDPFDPADIARALTRMADEVSLRRDLGQKAKQRALKFPTWDEVGQMTLSSLERALHGV